jgi:pimeloyl-ACP methyl ester carboxylesterase
MKRLGRIIAVLAAVLFAAVLLLRVPDTDVAAMRAKYGGPPSQFVTLPDGPTVHYRDEGPRDAPVIMLLHGSNADLHTWQPWVDRLKDRYRLIRLDQRGHGLTGPAPDGSYRQDAFTGDLEAFRMQLNLDRFVLAGNSMGGAIAARYAMTHPNRLAGLVLIDAGGAPVKRESGGGNLAFTIARIPVLNTVASQFMPRSLIERSLRQSVANQAVVTSATVDRYWELARFPGNRRATMARFGESGEPFTAARLAIVRTPTLVMWGERDQLILLSAGQWFARSLPNAQLVSYAGIGHLPMEEAPDQSADDLALFLTGLQ